jgi:hypothetical protein
MRDFRCFLRCSHNPGYGNVTKTFHNSARKNHKPFHQLGTMPLISHPHFFQPELFWHCNGPPFLLIVFSSSFNIKKYHELSNYSTHNCHYTHILHFLPTSSLVFARDFLFIFHRLLRCDCKSIERLILLCPKPSVNILWRNYNYNCCR